MWKSKTEDLSRWVNHELTYIANKYTLRKQSLIWREPSSCPRKTESSFCSLNFPTSSKELSQSSDTNAGPSALPTWASDEGMVCIYLSTEIYCGLKVDTPDQQRWLGWLSSRDPHTTEYLVQTAPEIPGENTDFLLPVLALKVEEAGTWCLPTFLLDTGIRVRERVSMSSLVVAAVRRTGLSITPRLQMLTRPTAPGFEAGLFPPYPPFQ